jgi:CubicO group peptidase (beta-lactamase class C family)
MLSRRLLASRAGAFLLAAGLPPCALAGSLPGVLKIAAAGATAPALGAVLIRNGRIDEAAVWGVRRIGLPGQVHSGDAWLIGSCTKAMTVTLAARLVERGALSWDKPLSAMLPDLAAAMQTDYRPVTLLQMLSHRAGFAHDDAAMMTDDLFLDRRPLPQQRLSYITDALKQAPAYTPGTQVSYSNIGFLLAAVIAERTQDVPYEELMRREIFRPLGMSSAVFTPPRDGQLAGHRDGRPAQPTESAPPLYGPAGLVRLSLNDWAKFCLDQLAGARGGGRLLSPGSYQLMQNPLPGIDNGLGWGCDPSIGGRKGPVIDHSGSEHNWYALVILFPATGDGILAAANAGDSMGGDAAVKAVVRGLLPSVSTPVT